MGAYVLSMPVIITHVLHLYSVNLTSMKFYNFCICLLTGKSVFLRNNDSDTVCHVFLNVRHIPYLSHKAAGPMQISLSGFQLPLWCLLLM